MIILAPIDLTQGEAASLRMTYRVNGIGKDFTGWTGTWVISQKGTTLASGTTDLQTDGDMVTAITVAQIDALSVPDQFKGRTLAETFFQITATDGTDTMHFRSAVNVFRGISYSSSTSLTASDLTDNDGNTLLAE